MVIEKMSIFEIMSGVMRTKIITIALFMMVIIIVVMIIIVMLMAY